MKQRNQSGDTLIEVAISIAMLGLVVTTVFMAANRSLATIMDATERTAVRASVNSQLDMIEYLRDHDQDGEWKKIVEQANIADPKKLSKEDLASIYNDDCAMRIESKTGSSIWLEYNPNPGAGSNKFVEVHKFKDPSVGIKELWESTHPGITSYSDSKLSLDKKDTQIGIVPRPGYGIWVDIVRSSANSGEVDGRYIEAIVRSCWSPLGSRVAGEGRIKVTKRFSVAEDKK